MWPVSFNIRISSAILVSFPYSSLAWPRSVIHYASSSIFIYCSCILDDIIIPY